MERFFNERREGRILQINEDRFQFEEILTELNKRDSSEVIVVNNHIEV